MKNSTAPEKRLLASPKADQTVPRDMIARQVSGNLALDFCNTVGEHLATHPDELFLDWECFLRWAAQAGLIGAGSYVALLGHPQPIAPIIKIREAIYRIGLAVARKYPIADRDLNLVSKCAAGAKPPIEAQSGTLHWRPSPSRASQQLSAVLASEALSLFCSPKAARIGVCEGGMCGWLYMDESRGQRRRWCDMNDCGSRAKARRYYETHKES